MAAGKSTVAESPTGRLPRAAHVRGDVFRRMVVSGREELLPEETAEARAQLGLRYRLSAPVADEYADHGWTAVVRDIVLGPGGYAARVGTRPLYVVVPAPSTATVRSREAQRPKTGYGDAWTVDALDRTLRELTPCIGLWLDTSQRTPVHTVSSILDDLSVARVQAD
ncbi:AAA family ATPase [Streptomyces sp. CA-251251]|uniref:AAA family ATPase n=1 Tax=Streptomyces sp. CA-251251 TaxID=3240063 RepID=UPI003D8DD6E8